MSNTARKRALLIGITQYGWSHAYAPPFDLVGPAADVAELAEVLQTHYGFAPADLTILHSEPGTPPDRLPTGANIRHALEELIAAAGPDDPVLVYYSGHGSQWPDPSGAETDGLDEALVVYDARDPQAVAPPQGDWLDKDQHSYYERLAVRTTHLTVIYDCCHSATGTRADDSATGLVARQLEADLTPLSPALRSEGRRDDFSPHAIGAGLPAARMVAAGNAAATAPDAAHSAAFGPPHYVMLAACRADERAYEGTLAAADACWPEEQVAVGRTVGLFTYFLLRALRHAPAATYADLLTLLRDGVSMKQATQHPQGEGPLDRQLFGGATRAVDWLPVTEATPSGVTLGAGSAHGLVPGTGIAVYPNPTATPDAPFSGEVPLGTATVARVYPLAATALFDSPPAGVLSAHVRALVVRPVYTGRQLRVAVAGDAGVPAEAIADIEAAVAAGVLLQLATDTPDVTITVGTDAIRCRVHASAPDGYPLPTPAPAPLLGQSPITDGTDPAAQIGDLRTQNLEGLARFREGLTRSNPAATLARAVQARLLPLDGGPTGSGELVLAPYSRFSIVLTYAAPDGPPLYYSLLRFAADGAVTQLWPPTGGEANESLRPGGQWPPPGAEANYGFAVETAAASAGDPPARDRIMVFTATAPLDLHSLEQAAFSGPAGTRDARLRAAPADPTRGDWASQTLAYRIE